MRLVSLAALTLAPLACSSSSVIVSAQADAGEADAPENACRSDEPFEAPRLEPTLNGPTEDQTLRLSADGLTAYFSRLAENGSYDLFTAIRPVAGQPFGSVRPMELLNTLARDGWPTVTADGLTLYFETNPNGDEEIYVATRSAASLEFSSAVPVTTLNEPALSTVDGAPSISQDGREIFFRSLRAGTIDLFHAVREGDGFGVPQPVSELNTSDGDSFPTLSSDGLTLVFSSTRTDGGAQGGYDIWIAQRPSVDQAFGPPRNLVELNTPDAEYANFLSHDGCTLYFHRLVAGINRIYFAERPR